jgi:N-acetylmuramoyl-L-alanine amidase
VHRPSRSRRLAVTLAALALSGLTACSGASGSGAGSGHPVSAAPPVGSVSASPRASGSASAAARPLAGKVIAIDPGHNGGNFAHPDEIARQVQAGGFSKECDTTGTETDAGYTEAAFTFDVATRLAALLRAEGATVVLTRTNNDTVGPCVDVRARIGNQAHANAAISLHADGGPPTGRGYHVMEPVLIKGYTDAIVGPSAKLAAAINAAYRAGTGMPPSNYIGTDGIDPRGDMGGLNLSTVPKVLVECGNMRNATDARLLTDATFRAKIAASLAAGMAAYLGA